MYISVTLSALFCACFSLGGMLIGFAITRAFYGQIAQDAQRELDRQRRHYENEMRQSDKAWCCYCQLRTERKNDE